MALSSALFSGISGLTNLGNAMQVIGDNIANVNTVGFKGSSFTFQDLLSQAMFTRAGTSQVGRGTALADIYSAFEQGSFESTGNTTDLAIGGDGFFVLRESTSDVQHYTRAGNFRFNKEGLLVNPEGYAVQGWGVDVNGEITGSTEDIALTSFTSEPEATMEVTIISNLDKDEQSNVTILSKVWDGTDSTPIDTSNYEYQSTVKVYDALGSTHDITVYFDKIQGSDWEYIVTCNPDEDMRAGFASTKSAGLLARGKLMFNEGSGAITSLSMSRLTGATDGTDQDVVIDSTPATAYTGIVTMSVDNPEILTTANAGNVTLTFDGTNWSSSGGYAVIDDTSTQVSIDIDGDASADIAVNLGTAATAGETLDLILTGSDDWTVQVASTDTNSSGYFEFQADFLGGTSSSTFMDIAFNVGTKYDGAAFAPDSLATSQYASSSTTVFQSADGYGAGALQGVDVDVDGLITGVYSNGQVLPLYLISLAKFQNIQGLHKEGGNLFRETRESGTGITNQPGTNGLGSIAPNSLEQSNVDIANEFVKMITTQRGFQANSKIITVTDQMLSDLINLKR